MDEGEVLERQRSNQFNLEKIELRSLAELTNLAKLHFLDKLKVEEGQSLAELVFFQGRSLLEMLNDSHLAQQIPDSWLWILREEESWNKVRVKQLEGLLARKNTQNKEGKKVVFDSKAPKVSGNFNAKGGYILTLGLKKSEKPSEERFDLVLKTIRFDPTEKEQWEAKMNSLRRSLYDSYSGKASSREFQIDF